MSEKQIDPRIGKQGEYAPLVCAVTGQEAIAGMPCTDVRLAKDSKYYYRVLAKAVPLADKPAIVKELEKVMSTLAGRQPKIVREVKKDDKS